MNKQLCYIDKNFAYFTSNMKKQWGDDWNDTPYEHNAGDPYTHNGESIEKIAFVCDLSTPAEIAGLNSNYSVQDINEKKTPWLSGKSMTTRESIEIYAGTTMEKFIETVLNSGGEIYLKFNRQLMTWYDI